MGQSRKAAHPVVSNRTTAWFTKSSATFHRPCGTCRPCCRTWHSNCHGEKCCRACAYHSLCPSVRRPATRQSMNATGCKMHGWRRALALPERSWRTWS